MLEMGATFLEVHATAATAARHNSNVVHGGASFPRPQRAVVSYFDPTTNGLTMSTNLSEETADDWISQAEAARIRGVSRQAIGRLIQRNRLETLSVGGRMLVRRKDIE